MIMPSADERDRRTRYASDRMGMAVYDRRIGEIPVNVGDAAWSRLGPTRVRMRVTVVERGFSGESMYVNGISVPRGNVEFMGMIG